MSLFSSIYLKLLIMIDIGANLSDDVFRFDLEHVVDNAFKANVKKIILTGTTVPISQKAKTIADKYTSSTEHETSMLYSTAGIHPHKAKYFDSNSISELKKLLDTKYVVAVGECGLDYNRMLSPKEAQIFCLEEHLKLAEHYKSINIKRPLFLHDRDSHDDFLNIVKKHELPGVVHCFTGTAEQAQRYIKLGFHIGITGWICDDRRNADVIKAMNVIPLDKLLIETDAPYLQPLKTIRRNEPKYLPLVVTKIASVMGYDEDAIIKRTTENAQLLFDLDN